MLRLLVLLLLRLVSGDSQKGHYGQAGSDQSVVYRAGVVEFAPCTNFTLSPMARMLENVQSMLNFTKEAKEKRVDILVFPENGIVSVHPDNRTDAGRYGQYVPDPKDNVVPCLSSSPQSTTQITNALSCMARDGGMYVVVNLAERVDCNKTQDKTCDDDRNIFYNCNVVFDRNGTVIAKWRKLHLWHENPWYNYGNLTNEEAMFTTDFGVTFTQHICFDVFFQRPSLANIAKYGVNDVIMSTAWIDSLPFRLAPQWQYGWSREANVNLLASGLHLLYKGSLGSGIYPSGSHPKNFTYVWDDSKEGSTLVVSDVWTRRSSLYKGEVVASRNPAQQQQHRGQYKLKENVSPQTKSRSSIPTPHHKVLHMNLSSFSTFDLPPNTFMETTVCDTSKDQTEVCCQIKWDNPNGKTHYLLMASSGVLNDTGYGIFNQICAVVHCPTGQVDSCAKVGPSTEDTLVSFNLTGLFRTPYVQPSVITQDLKLLSEEHWTYETFKADYTWPTDAYITSPTIKNLMAATLWGRYYDKDPYCQKHPC